MISIIKNNYRRLMSEKFILIVMLVLTTAAISAALFMSSRTDSAGHIAVLADDPSAALSVPGLKFSILDQAPADSELVSGKYDAFVETGADGTYQITILKSEEIHDTLLALLNGHITIADYQADQRGTGTTILGFMLMFILMEGSMLMGMFAEDREKKQIFRVTASPISIGSYLSAHCIFNFCFLYVPSMAILFLIKIITSMDIGMSFPRYALLLFLLCALATAFSLFLNALASSKDNATMGGNTIIILTSVLAGSFYSFDKGNKVLETIVRFLPQKSYLSLAQALENGAALSTWLPYLLYLAALIILFTALSIRKIKQAYQP